MQTISLSDLEASQFLEWRRHQENFAIIMQSGVMDIREGSSEIHFDAQGRIGAIKAHVNVYKHDPSAALMVVKLSP